MTISRWRTIILSVLVIGMTYGRVVWSARIELTRADALVGREKVEQLGLAARLYAPGNAYAARALESLRELGAWSTIRGAILSSRSFYTPNRALLDEANRHLDVRTEAASSPALGATVLALLGLTIWLASAVGLLGRAIAENLEWSRRAFAYGAGVIVGLTLFAMGLHWA